MHAVKRLAFPIISLVLLLGVFFVLLHMPYPLIGQDYSYIFPRLLAGKWHFAHAGLLPFRYIPHLCGGFPLYGNPQDFYYSLLQFLGMSMDLWVAAQIVVGLTMVAGYAGWVLFGRDVLALPRPWAHFLAIAILASGYLTLHMLLGHLTFHTTPLLGWFLWFLLDPRTDDRRTQVLKACGAGFLGAWILYAGGYFVLLQGVLLYALLLPYVLTVSDEPLWSKARRLASRALWSGVPMFFVGLSKFVAVWSFMRFFPRFSPYTRFESPENILVFFGKSFWLIPQWKLAHQEFVFPAGLHEYAMFFTPIVAIGLIAMLAHVGMDAKTRGWGRTGFLVAYSMVLLLIFAQIARGYGVLADFIHGLPLFSSVRMNIRFVYLLTLLLTMGGTVALARLAASRRAARWSSHVAGSASLLTIALLFIAYRTTISPEYLDLTTPYDKVRQAIALNPDFVDRPVWQVEDLRGQNEADFRYVLVGTTGKSCYETILGGGPVPDLRPGPTTDIIDGAFNITHPACMQYPEANGCTPGDRIPETDEDNARLYLTGEQPAWKVSWLQRVADVMSIMSLVAILGILVYFAVLRLYTRFRAKNV